MPGISHSAVYENCRCVQSWVTAGRVAVFEATSSPGLGDLRRRERTRRPVMRCALATGRRPTVPSGRRGACVKQLGSHPFDGDFSDAPDGPLARWLCDHITDPKGGDSDEWPNDELRVREFPQA